MFCVYGELISDDETVVEKYNDTKAYKHALSVYHYCCAFHESIISEEDPSLEPDYTLIISHCILALEYEPNNIKARILRGKAHHKLGDYDDAITEFLKAIEDDPENAETYPLISKTCLQRGDNKNAKTYLQLAKTLGANDPSIDNSLRALNSLSVKQSSSRDLLLSNTHKKEKKSKETNKDVEPPPP